MAAANGTRRTVVANVLAPSIVDRARVGGVHFYGRTGPPIGSEVVSRRTPTLVGTPSVVALSSADVRTPALVDVLTSRLILGECVATSAGAPDTPFDDLALVVASAVVHFAGVLLGDAALLVWG